MFIIKKIFKNSDNQIRSGWKVFLVVVLTVISLLIFAAILNLLNLTDRLGILLALAMVLAVAIMLKFIDRKGFNYIGLTTLKKSYKKLLIGLFLGLFLISLNVLILRLTGHLEFETELFNPNISSFLLFGLLQFLIVGIGEEVLFRGYIISTLQQMNKPWLSIILSSLIFTIPHSGNAGGKLIPLVNLFLAGVLLAYIYIKTKNLYTVIGFHITWNYFQGYIYGANVSGIKVEDAAYTIKLKDQLLSGGNFGLEGGLVNTIVIILGILVIYWLYERINISTNQQINT
mgnify:CR=1 FL=1